MAKKSNEKVINLDTILFNCRDILRAARNSGSFFEKRDMMLTLVFLRFIGEKYEDGIVKLKEKLIKEGLDLDDENVRATADKLYDDLKKMGVEVIYDDRNVSAGVMFSDADLIGVPVRMIVSPRTLERGAVELSARDKSFQIDLKPEEAASAAKAKVCELIDAINAKADQR